MQPTANPRKELSCKSSYEPPTHPYPSHSAGLLQTDPQTRRRQPTYAKLPRGIQRLPTRTNIHQNGNVESTDTQ
ncbi:hypothetical protein BDW02DRAFT_564625 [Decorospora gaudefroyi]|uniref:Uncharacterized protein n=1 Tax=Decorospora gaudefroyi TaxID=184978 RepID=A0A6A5KRK2_9PLEO|nr:hypothetical protein BDW02DRAFT_564625 [Decorospora gaudefroyi]